MFLNKKEVPQKKEETHLESDRADDSVANHQPSHANLVNNNKKMMAMIIVAAASEDDID